MAKKEKKQKRRLSPAEKATNAVLTLVVLVVLGLAVYAVGPQVKTGVKNVIAEKQAQEALENPGPDTSVISGLCESLGMSVDEFKAEFGFGDDVTGESLTNDVLTEDFINALPLSKYAKLTGMEYSALVEEMGIADKVTEETLYSEAEVLIPLGNMAGGEEGFAQMKEYYAFDETVTVDTPYGDVKDMMAEVDAQKAAEAEAAAAAAEAEAAAAEQTAETAENTEANAETEQTTEPVQNAEATEAAEITEETAE